MNQLSNILTVSNILLDQNVTSKKRAFEQVALLFENNEGISRSVISDSLFSRERLGSTALGHGVAIPHGRIQSLERPLAAFMRLENAIPFDAPDNQNVNLLMILLVPENATQEHLEILAHLAHVLSNEEIRKQLREEKEPQRIFELLTTQP
ncbi:PTS sugar transporter subunit IIA [Brackiella oedipodis]|uniref:PTS sugar transporter subunit IIA n=1 Tax=Brackiella oedipodis TaxID=124225 RepID=UPI00049169BB|nr:PTS sugar transporter subunit IIA [Brackiella oedipodis]